MRDLLEDDDYWGLTPMESARYHGRLSAYHGERSRALGEQAARYGRKARIALIVSLVLQVLAVAIRIIGAVADG